MRLGAWVDLFPFRKKEPRKPRTPEKHGNFQTPKWKNPDRKKAQGNFQTPDQISPKETPNFQTPKWKWKLDRAPNAKSTGIRRIPLRAAVVTGRGAPLGKTFPPTHCILGLRLLARYVPWHGVRVSCLVVWYLVWFGMVVCPTPSGVSSGGRGCGCDACVILVQAPLSACYESSGHGGSIGRSTTTTTTWWWWVVVVGKEGMLTDRRANRWLVGCGMMMNRRTHTKKRKSARTKMDEIHVTHTSNHKQQHIQYTSG